MDQGWIQSLRLCGLTVRNCCKSIGLSHSGVPVYSALPFFVFTGYVQLCEDLVLTAIQLLFCVLAYVRVRVN